MKLAANIPHLFTSFSNCYLVYC